MENQVQTVGAVSSNLDKARSALVGGVAKTGELIKAYANALCVTFNEVDSSGTIITPWYDLTGKAKAGVKAERAKFVAEMESRGFGKGTIDVYWMRAKEESGRVKTENRVTGSTSTDEKTLSDLKTLINRIFKAEENGEDCNASSFKGALIAVYESLGGEVDKLG